MWMFLLSIGAIGVGSVRSVLDVSVNAREESTEVREAAPPGHDGTHTASKCEKAGYWCMKPQEAVPDCPGGFMENDDHSCYTGCGFGGCFGRSKKSSYKCCEEIPVTEELPEEYLCPISLELMSDPVALVVEDWLDVTKAGTAAAGDNIAIKASKSDYRYDEAVRANYHGKWYEAQIRRSRGKPYTKFIYEGSTMRVDFDVDKVSKLLTVAPDCEIEYGNDGVVTGLRGCSKTTTDKFKSFMKVTQVFSSSSFVFDRKNILDWWTRESTNPMTGLACDADPNKLVALPDLQNTVKAWKRQHPN